MLSKADLEQSRVEYALDGAQLAAAATIVRAGVAGPFHWTSSTDQGFVDIRAEREADKLSLASAAGLPPAVFARFGVADPAGLQARLQAAAGAPVADVAGLDNAALWRVCAGRAMSSFGQQTGYTYVEDIEPAVGDHPALWRVGETWRVRVTTATGWHDDRIVRFTGDARSDPAAIVLRTFARGESEGGRCEEILQAMGAT